MNGCIVTKPHEFYNSDSFQFREIGDTDIRNALISASRLNLNNLIIELDIAPAATLLSALHTYRVQRPTTRIICIAQGRQPGDKTVAGIVAMGIYDILAPEDEDYIPELQDVINNPPATYTQAARWAQAEEEPVKAKQKKLWDRKKTEKPVEPEQNLDLLAKIIKDIESLNTAMADLKTQAQTDPLTGLYNREFMENWLKIQFAQGDNFSVAFIDLDKFKSVNDTYGHAAGDAVLRQFSAFLQTQVRTSDVVIRYGGEEIIVGLPGTNLQAATNLIERIRQIWEQTDIPISPDQSICVTFSAGVADYKTSKKDILKTADKLVYQAKNTGRNQVCSGVVPKVKSKQTPVKHPEQPKPDQPTNPIYTASPTISVIADGTATVGDTTGAILSIVYHSLRTGFYLLLLVVLISMVLFVGGKVAGILPTHNSVTQFLISASATIGNLLKYLF